jgi:PKD repeat protein
MNIRPLFRISRQFWIFLSTCLILAGLLVVWVSPASASDPVEKGYRDHDYGGSDCNSTPTGEKPESKLWYNDGIWWGSLCNPDENDNHIYRLDFATQSWLDTGTVLDTRAGTKADALWDEASQKLSLVSHIFTNNGRPSNAFSQQGHLFRYSYNSGSKSYSLDSGFPVSVTGGRSETLTLAKDSTGRLWVTYVEDEKVFVNHSTTNDSTWRTPYTLPVASTALNVTDDDISSVISFDDDKIGVMWSNENQMKFYFAVHQDGAADNIWQVDAADLPGLPCSGACGDDHINLKTDSSGRIFAAVKTSLEEDPDPLVMLLVRNVNGTWNSHVFGTELHRHTRPIVMLDEENDVLYMFATSPETNGKIYYKSTDVDNINFPAGLGTLFISSTTETRINNPTSTKQNVNGETDLVVMASEGFTFDYFHNYLDLPSATTPPPPAANFSGTPTSGIAPLQVQFTDLSTNSPTSWSWNFGNGGSSAQKNPSHTYTTPGVYTVVLTATNTGGSDAETKTGYITVTTPPPVANFSGTPTSGVAPLQVQFTDQSTNSPTAWSWNFGDGGSSTQKNPSHTYTTPGVYTVVLTATNTGGSDAETKTAYVTVATPPPVANFSGTPTLGVAPLQVQFTDLSSNSPTAWSWNFGDGGSSSQKNPSHTYTSTGVYTVTLTATNAGGSDAETKTAYINVTTTPPPAANFSGTPTSGTAPLTVQFSDLSSESPTAWSWNFGDGGSSTLQNPSHTYITPGVYTVVLTATNTIGSDSETRTDYITVNPASNLPSVFLYLPLLIK